MKAAYEMDIQSLKAQILTSNSLEMQGFEIVHDTSFAYFIYKKRFKASNQASKLIVVLLKKYNINHFKNSINNREKNSFLISIFF